MKKMRETLKFSQERMAGFFGVQRSSYTKYENGDTFPGEQALKVLAENFDISLDWLICNKGPMFYKEKAPWEELDSESDMKVLRELFEYMVKYPFIRYRMLSDFYSFKLKNNNFADLNEAS